MALFAGRRLRGEGFGPSWVRDARASGAQRRGSRRAARSLFLTAFLNLFMLAEVSAGDSALIHGGGSGVGTAAITLLHEAGVRALVTAGSADKCERCLRLGADSRSTTTTVRFA